MGRFLNRDPIGTQGGENLYEYAGDDPVNEVDPSGDADLVGGLEGFGIEAELKILGEDLEVAYKIAHRKYIAFAGTIGKYDTEAADNQYIAGTDPYQISPLGFSSTSEYKQFAGDLYTRLNKAGYTDSECFMRGSSVTGESFKTGAPFGPQSDYDVAVASESPLSRAKAVGVKLISQGTRTVPLTNGQVMKLGLGDLQQSLSASVGRKVSLMIYNSVSSVTDRGHCLPIPAPAGD
jgi:hypothetical protein